MLSCLQPISHLKLKVKTDCVTARWQPVEICRRWQTDESASATSLHIPVTPSIGSSTGPQEHTLCWFSLLSNVYMKQTKTKFYRGDACHVFFFFKEADTNVCHSVRCSSSSNTQPAHLTEALSGSTLSREADSLTGLQGWVSSMCNILWWSQDSSRQGTEVVSPLRGTGGWMILRDVMRVEKNKKMEPGNRRTTDYRETVEDRKECKPESGVKLEMQEWIGIKP